ncbi:unnamed protein product [Rhodiola kirilowii]
MAVICFIIRNSGDSNDEELELLGANARPYTFNYSELRTATEGFSRANKLGEGGFGPIYKGKLNDGKVIAVKQLSVGSHQGKTQFYTEIATISAGAASESCQTLWVLCGWGQTNACLRVSRE